MHASIFLHFDDGFVAEWSGSGDLTRAEHVLRLKREEREYASVHMTLNDEALRELHRVLSERVAQLPVPEPAAEPAPTPAGAPA